MNSSTLSRHRRSAVCAARLATPFPLAALLGLVGALACPVAFAEPQEPELAQAPLRFESQDTSQWSHDLVTKEAKTREQVVTLYQNMYLPGNGVALNWTGAIATCNPGTTNIEHQQAVIDRVNYYRALVELPPVTLLSGSAPMQVQAAALMMSAHNALSHTPPPSWTCYSAAGAEGAMNANIALGLRGVAAIDAFMADSGPGNAASGHRRWILYPPRTGMATGDVPAAIQPAANALYVFGPQGTRPATPSGIAWPPAGFVPYQNLPASSNRWSLSFPNANFANAVVTMSGPAGPIPVTLEPLANGFGDNTIVFLPTGVPYTKPAADTTYTVTVSGMSGPGVPASIQYQVTAIDPDATPPAPMAVEVVEFYNAVLDHYFITWGAEEIAKLDAGRTPTRWRRTGETFKAHTTAQPGTSPVCRYYIPPGKGDSHFFGRGTVECNATGAAYPDFFLEEANYMHMYLPVEGVCPAGTIEVSRAFSNRADANHRYMIMPAIRGQMVAQGWLAEGDGANFVVMCAPA